MVDEAVRKFKYRQEIAGLINPDPRIIVAEHGEERVILP